MNPITHPYVVTGYLTSVITLAVGIFVYAKKPSSAIHRSFLFFSLAIWQWSFFTALQAVQSSYGWAHFFGKFCHIGVMWIPVFFYYFTLKITESQSPRLLKTGFGAAVLLTIMIFGTPYFIPRERTDAGVPFLAEGGPLYIVIIGYFFAYAALALKRLSNEIKNSSGARRKHLRYFFLASVIGFGIGGFNFFPVYGILIPPYPYSASSGALYSCVIAYAILRHRLFDIELIVKKGIVFGFLFGFIYTAVSSLIFLAGYFAAHEVSPALLSGASIAIAMLLYEPLKTLLTQWTHRFLFQRKTAYTSLVHALTEKLASIHDPPALAAELTEFLTEQMALEWAGFYLRDEGRPGFYLSPPEKSAPITDLDDRHPIAELARKRKTPFILSPFDVENELGSAAKLSLREIGVEAVVPISNEEEDLYGILVLGKKKSDDVFSEEDEALLQTVMEEMGMFFLSARLLKEVTRVNLELGQRKKMAAVVQLSRGIRHEIKNPLHTIELLANHTLRLAEDIQNAQTSTFAETAERHVASMLEEITRIQDSLNRFEQFALPLAEADLKPLRLKDEIEKFILLMREGQKLDRIEVHQSIPEDIYVLAAEGILQAVFFALFDNASEAMNGAGKLYLETQSEGAWVSFKMRDTGAGIRKEVLPHIFEAFFTTKKNSESVGIGLAVVKHHLEHLGGRIEARSFDEGGAEFTVHLRRAERMREFDAA